MYVRQRIVLTYMVWFSRKAKKTAKQLQRKKDMEQGGFDTLKACDTMKSSDSQTTQKTQTTIIDQSDDKQSECSVEPDKSATSTDIEMDTNRYIKALNALEKTTPNIPTNSYASPLICSLFLTATVHAGKEFSRRVINYLNLTWY